MTTDKAAAPVGAVPQGDAVRVLIQEREIARRDCAAWVARAEKAEAALASQAARMGEDTARLDYIERTFSGMTNRERYLPVQMIWGTGAMGRTLREACDKYMKRGHE